MNISNLETIRLMPAFAKTDFMNSMCSVLDEVFRHLAERVEALPCEASTSALQACRDDELAQIASDLNVVPYYPDLSREIRENFIKESDLWTRKTGTNAAIVAMINALFAVTTAQIIDNEILYHYDMDVEGINEASELNINRIENCLRVIGRASQAPNSFVFRFDCDIERTVLAVSGDVLVLCDTDELCTYPHVLAVGGNLGGEEVNLIPFGAMASSGFAFENRRMADACTVYGGAMASSGFAFENRRMADACTVYGGAMASSGFAFENRRMADACTVYGGGITADV